VRAGENMPTLNRSAIVVTPKQPFLDWLHTTDAMSAELTLLELIRDPTIYLIPECDTDEDVVEVLRDLCEEIFKEQLAGWYRDDQSGRKTGASTNCDAGSIISTIS